MHSTAIFKMGTTDKTNYKPLQSLQHKAGESTYESDLSSSVTFDRSGKNVTIASCSFPLHLKQTCCPPCKSNHVKPNQTISTWVLFRWTIIPYFASIQLSVVVIVIDFRRYRRLPSRWSFREVQHSTSCTHDFQNKNLISKSAAMFRSSTADLGVF